MLPCTAYDLDDKWLLHRWAIACLVAQLSPLTLFGVVLLRLVVPGELYFKRQVVGGLRLLSPPARIGCTRRQGLDILLGGRGRPGRVQGYPIARQFKSSSIQEALKS